MNFILRLALLFGIRIGRTPEGILVSRSRFRPGEAETNRWFAALRIGTVIDIGAHTGESSVWFRQLFPAAVIYAFEPLGDCHQRLTERFKKDAAFRAFRSALSDIEGEADFYRSRYAPSSSLLQMTPTHCKEFEGTELQAKETVRVTTLDTVMESLPLKDGILLKIDVQGAEERVLRGGVRTLARVQAIIIETSFVELYKGQPLFRAVYETLNEYGFAYAGSVSQFRGPKSGAPLQQDSLFLRKDKCLSSP